LLSLPRFGLFTTICEKPYSFDAGRFSDDMIVVEGSQSVRSYCD
jgi:hypothetical protein